MWQLQMFLRLPRAEQLLLLRALVLVLSIRIGLSTLRFQTIRRAAEHMAMPLASAQTARRPTADRIAWSVAVTATYVPAASCLTQALATRVLLGRHSYACELRIGVARDNQGKLEAHAWIEHEGRILIGGPATHIARFTPLPTL